MTGLPLMGVFVLSIIFLILMISKWKIHPFLSLLFVSLVFGLIGGIPLLDVKDADGTLVTPGIASVIGDGFAATFKSFGLVVIFGTLIGFILEKTGAAFQLADAIVRVIGTKHPVLAIQLMGWVVCIPVFSDSGFVILNPVRRALAQRTGASPATMAIALSAGLFTSHVFIPPTPGPLASASNLGLDTNLLLVMALGALVSIPVMVAAYFYSVWIGPSLHTPETEAVPDTDVEAAYNELKNSYTRLPSTALSLAQILVPILLIAAGSITSAAGVGGWFGRAVVFAGTPVIALAIGFLFAVLLVAETHMMDRFYTFVEDGLRTVGPIILITAASGVLGRVISSTDVVDFISNNATQLASLGLFFPFLITALFKTAQGSATVAMVTTSSLVAPLLPTLGLETPVQVGLAVLAISASSLVVSHANDSHFWVVTNFSKMTPQQAYRSQTAVTGVMGCTAMVFIWILGLFLV
ncbi:GntP family permease [Corynebacterium lipophiloflavum]|uniref:GntP family permease n=1 Tax=Corynebacterium lipophiloflavum (strain ATCC 700352 / DSM 44291 / CCUG 37336 / JCM 10383 / DMMZ 1944) TaxID=525263 RepID=C0XQA4_CORLD|nr:GntP family permease [Corynebacterium lipophiloflavum]EEI17592.1 GntP family permease [Corynebacterium lipophiloflavum DSM 44291]